MSLQQAYVTGKEAALATGWHDKGEVSAVWQAHFASKSILLSVLQRQEISDAPCSKGARGCAGAASRQQPRLGSEHLAVALGSG